MNKKIDQRIKDVESIGMIFNFQENSFIGKDNIIKDFNIYVTEMQFDDKSTWNSKIEHLKEELLRRKSK